MLFSVKIYFSGFVLKMFFFLLCVLARMKANSHQSMPFLAPNHNYYYYTTTTTAYVFPTLPPPPPHPHPPGQDIPRDAYLLLRSVPTYMFPCLTLP